MEPETAEKYERLLTELQKAAEEDPHGDQAKDLRGQIEAILREHLGPGAEPVLPGDRTTH